MILMLKSMMISFSVLILLLLLFRKVFQNKIDPMLQYGLWSLVPLRLLSLLIPSFPELQSSVSVMNVVRSVSQASPQILHFSDSSIPLSDTAVAVHSPLTGVMDWDLVLVAFWVIGCLTVGGFFIYTHLSFGKKLMFGRKVLSHTPVLGKPSDHKKTLTIYLTEQITSPCLFHYKGETAIYVTPNIAQDPEVLQFAITHELCHYRHHDLAWSALRCTLLALCWFHPLIWAAAIFSKRDGELACDGSVIQLLGEEKRFSYGRTIVQLANNQKCSALFYTSTAMSGSKRGVKERIGRIARQKKMMAVTLITVMICAVFTVGFTFTQAPGPQSPSDMLKARSFASNWAQSYTARDAKTIYQLCTNEKLFLEVGYQNDDGTRGLGWSSPWPWGDHPYDLVMNSDDTFTVYYQFLVSEPDIYITKQVVQYKKEKGEYKATKVTTEEFDSVCSKKEFEEAYEIGFPDYMNFAEPYQAHLESGQTDAKIVCNPYRAAAYQLHLAGGKSVAQFDGEPQGKAIVTYTWKDGSVSLDMVQPGVQGERGIWVFTGLHQD